MTEAESVKDRGERGKSWLRPSLSQGSCNVNLQRSKKRDESERDPGSEIITHIPLS